MKQPSTGQLLKEINKIEKQMNEIKQIGELKPNKAYKRTPSKETRNKQALRGLQTRANKMGFNLPQFNDYSLSERVHLQKQFLNNQLQNKLNYAKSQLNSAPIQKSFTIQGVKFNTKGLSKEDFNFLVSYRNRAINVLNNLKEDGASADLLDQLKLGRTSFKILANSDKSNDVKGSFDELNIFQIDIRNYDTKTKEGVKKYLEAIKRAESASNTTLSNWKRTIEDSVDFESQFNEVVAEVHRDRVKSIIDEIMVKVKELSLEQKMLLGAQFSLEEYFKKIDVYLGEGNQEQAKLALESIIKRINRIKRDNNIIYSRE